MKIKDIERKLNNEAKDSKVEIRVENFPSGYWLNPIDNSWITKRVYVIPTTKIKFGKLVRSINRLNDKLVKSNQSNIQILLTK